MTRVPLDHAYKLSRMVRDARHAAGLTQEELSEAAEVALRRLADADDATPAEREVWLSTSVTARHVGYLENCPAHPLSSPSRRARLLGVAVVLDLDRDAVNRYAGGV